MRTLKSILLAGAMLLAIPAFFSSCQEDGTQLKYKVEVTVSNDFSKVVEAINNGTLKNEQAIVQLTAAIDKMNADQQTKLQAIKDVLNSVNATIDTKLAAIEAAMKAQTLSLEGKLALIEAAMKVQTLTIEKKCDAIVAAIKALPDYTAKLQAIEKAINALPDYTAKLEAIEKALTSQTLALAEKLAFIQGALEDQTIAMKEKMDILKGVIDDQTKALDLRLGALETAMKNQTLELKDKLALLNSTLENQTLTLANKLEAISSAVEAMPDYTSKLAAIEAAIKALPNYEAQLKALNNLITDQNSKLDDQIAALEGIKNAIPDYSNKLDAIEKAIKAMPDYNAAINSIKDEIADLVKAVKAGNKSEADALAEIAKKIEALKGAGGGSTTEVKDYVDLGLPSGLLWGKYNIGASNEKDAGSAYSWGGITALSRLEGNKWFYDETYPYLNEKAEWTKYNSKDKKTILDAVDDIANVKLGGNWRIPSPEEWQELLDNCEWTLYLKNYYKITGKGAYSKNYIILPIIPSNLNNPLSMEDYQSNKLFVDEESDYHWGYKNNYIFKMSDKKVTNDQYRYIGSLVRPVYDLKK